MLLLLYIMSPPPRILLSAMAGARVPVHCKHISVLVLYYYSLKRYTPHRSVFIILIIIIIIFNDIIIFVFLVSIFSIREQTRSRSLIRANTKNRFPSLKISIASMVRSIHPPWSCGGRRWWSALPRYDTMYVVRTPTSSVRRPSFHRRGPVSYPLVASPAIVSSFAAQCVCHRVWCAHTGAICPGDVVVLPMDVQPATGSVHDGAGRQQAAQPVPGRGKSR